MTVLNRVYLLLLTITPLLVNGQTDTIVPPFQCEGLDTITTWQGIKIIKIKTVQNGTKGKKGDRIEVRYVGYLENGSVFDENWTKDRPFAFRLNKLEVIKGWDASFSILAEGEKARIIVPWKLAYGKYGKAEIIPPKADLTFDVYLVQVTKSAY